MFKHMADKRWYNDTNRKYWPWCVWQCVVHCCSCVFTVCSWFTGCSVFVHHLPKGSSLIVYCLLIGCLRFRSVHCVIMVRSQLFACRCMFRVNSRPGDGPHNMGIGRRRAAILCDQLLFSVVMLRSCACSLVAHFFCSLFVHRLFTLWPFRVYLLFTVRLLAHCLFTCCSEFLQDSSMLSLLLPIDGLFISVRMSLTVLG